MDSEEKKHIEVRVNVPGSTDAGIGGQMGGKSWNGKWWKRLANRLYRNAQKRQLTQSLLDDEIDPDGYDGCFVTSWDIW